MQDMGNTKARLLYEANLPENFRRPQTDQYPFILLYCGFVKNELIFIVHILTMLRKMWKDVNFIILLLIKDKTCFVLGCALYIVNFC